MKNQDVGRPDNRLCFQPQMIQSRSNSNNRLRQRVPSGARFAAAELQNQQPKATVFLLYVRILMGGSHLQAAGGLTSDQSPNVSLRSHESAVQWDCVGYSVVPVNIQLLDRGKTQHFRRMNVLNFPTSEPVAAIMSQHSFASPDLFCTMFSTADDLFANPCPSPVRPPVSRRQTPIERKA